VCARQEAEAEAFRRKKEAEANKKLLTPQYLDSQKYASLSGNSKVYFGPNIPTFFQDASVHTLPQQQQQTTAAGAAQQQHQSRAGLHAGQVAAAAAGANTQAAAGDASLGTQSTKQPNWNPTPL
jgi:hypothetical protein